MQATAALPFWVINLYKPEGPTSHDVVACLRKVFGIRKIGHLGTLDPLAEGVLPVCVGNATRLIEYFPTGKRYRAEILLGQTTTTLDREGEITAQIDASHITEADVLAILPQFTGTLQQQVPLHSAVHVNGKKLYRYAQAGQGETVTLPVKTVTIEALTLVGFTQAGQTAVATVEVTCGGGTYIRSLARDIGNALGVGGTLQKLVRTAHGRFTEASAIPLETLQQSATPEQYGLDPVSFLGLSVVDSLSSEDIQQLASGMKIMLPEASRFSGNQVLMVVEKTASQNVPVAICQVDGKRLKPVKVFYQKRIPV